MPIVKHVTVLRGEFEREPKKVQKLVESKLKYPVFVKPANLGSSVGISKAHDRKELGPAIAEAAKFDRKIVIEEGVGGKKNKAREIECEEDLREAGFLHRLDGNLVRRESAGEESRYRVEHHGET